MNETSFPTQTQLELPGRERPYVMAHRGTMAHEPENTMRSFRRALAEGADLIETDIHFTLDWMPVCIHDETVDRTMDGTGRVRDMTLAQLKQLRARNADGSVSEEAVPSLREFLDLIPGDRGVALELKDDRVVDPALGMRIVTMLLDARMKGRAVVLSFKREHLRAMREFAPWLPAGLITMGNYLPLHPFELCGPHPKILALNKLYVWLAHRLGKVVCPLDPWPEDRLGWYRRLGVDAVLTNDPAKTVGALGRREAAG